MKESEAPEESFGDVSPVRAAVQIQDFLWRPRSVKMLWLISFSYWGGVVAAEAKPDALSFVHTVVGGYIAIFLCPPFVFMALFSLFMKSWFAQLDMSEWESVQVSEFQENLHSGRRTYGEVGGYFDATADPTNPRSGTLYLRHIGVMED